MNGGNSVLYLVASTLSDIFKAKLLDTARAIFLVCDPKRRDAHHCEACKGKYTTAYAKKCSCTGRNGAQGRTDKARAAYTAALAAFNEEISDDPDDQELRDAAGERLSAAFKKLMAATDTVTHALEDAVLHFAGEWNDKVREARALAAKGVALPKKSEEQGWAQRPFIYCIGSPVEADDQLGYYVRVGLVQVVLATDTDFVCNGGLPCVAKGGVNNKTAVGKTPIFVYTKDSVTERARLLFRVQPQVNFDYDAARFLLTCLSNATGNDYMFASCPVVVASEIIAVQYTEFLAGRLSSPLPSEEWLRQLSAAIFAKNHSDERPRTSKEKYLTAEAYAIEFIEAHRIYFRGRQYVRLRIFIIVIIIVIVIIVVIIVFVVVIIILIVIIRRLPPCVCVTLPVSFPPW